MAERLKAHAWKACEAKNLRRFESCHLRLILCIINKYIYKLIKIYMVKANSAFMKPLNLSDDLAEVVGKGPMPRSEVVKQLWAYIKSNNLQDEKDKRNINADEKLEKIFGKKKVNMFEMTKLVSAHLS